MPEEVRYIRGEAWHMPGEVRVHARGGPVHAWGGPVHARGRPVHTWGRPCTTLRAMCAGRNTSSNGPGSFCHRADMVEK